MTYESGVTPNMIQRLCIKYNITHYCLDIENNFLIKHIPTAYKNYDVLCYVAHSNHMHLIKDKKFIQRISQSRSNEESKMIIKSMADTEKRINI